VGGLDAAHPIPKFPTSVRGGCFRPGIRHGVVPQSCVNVRDEDGEDSMEKEPITGQSGCCVGVRMGVCEGQGGIGNAPVRMVPGMGEARYRRS